jgi:valyl-tRNA synthetase
MHQRVHKVLDETLQDSINFTQWVTPDDEFVDPSLEQAFDTFLAYLSLTYSARQAAKIKRRWPLNKAVLAGPESAQKAVKPLEDLFLKLANVKSVEYVNALNKGSSELSERGSLASENDLHVLLDTQRGDALKGEGLMRDLARRIQSLRKDLGFTPTEILEVVFLAELDAKSRMLLKPHLRTMAELVRMRKVHVLEQKDEIKAEWHKYKVDHRQIYIAIPDPPS